MVGGGVLGDGLGCLREVCFGGCFGGLRGKQGVDFGGSAFLLGVLGMFWGMCEFQVASHSQNDEGKSAKSSCFSEIKLFHVSEIEFGTIWSILRMLRFGSKCPVWSKSQPSIEMALLVPKDPVPHKNMQTYYAN